MNPELQLASMVIQLILSICTLIGVIYAGYKFLKNPRDLLEKRIDAIEKRVDTHDLKFESVDASLKHGNDKFRKQADINEVFINCMLAFIDFEMAYCQATNYEDIDDLKNAKSTLRKYLANTTKR